MDVQNNALLSWAYYCQGKTMEELRQSLLYSTLELEQTKLVVQEELKKRDDLLIHLKYLLTKTMKERDEANEKCQRLILDNLLLQQQQPQQKTVPLPASGASSVNDEQQQVFLPQPTQPRKAIDSNRSFSSSDCEDSIVSPAVIDPINIPVQPEGLTIEIPVRMPEKPLPEKGKLLQAVLKAGPLLQTLLLAGPLPQWRHPPPPLETFEIPPVTVLPQPPQAQPQLQDSIVNSSCGKVNRKRVLTNADPMETKYQKVLLH